MQKFSLAVFIIFLLGSFVAVAFPVNKKITAKVQMDTSKVSVKKLDTKAIQSFKADKDFNYDDHSNGGEASLWSRFWGWLWDVITRLFNRIPYSGTILKYFFLALAIGAIALVIFKSLGFSPIQLMRGDAKKIAVPYSESLENIHEINFDAEIEAAVAQHNYRLAVRLLYLKCLKLLSDAELIKWQIDKTNTAYVYELKSAEQKQTFKLLTRQFEYVWYGNFAIDKEAFGNINQLFQNFKQQLP